MNVYIEWPWLWLYSLSRHCTASWHMHCVPYSNTNKKEFLHRLAHFLKFMTSSRYLGISPHWSRIRPSAFAALTSVDGAEEKGNSACTSGWVRGPTSMPAHGYRMEAEGEPSVQTVHLHLLDVHTRQLDKRLWRCTLRRYFRSSRTRCSPVRKPVWMQLHSGTWGAWQTWPCVPPKPPPKPLGVRCPAW